jgi:hypothetical protein
MSLKSTPGARQVLTVVRGSLADQRLVFRFQTHYSMFYIQYTKMQNLHKWPITEKTLNGKRAKTGIQMPRNPIAGIDCLLRYLCSQVCTAVYLKDK